ncbi:universal stress protein [Natrinema salaciae]|uniref:Nucleotide-binding universal stress protein, UspA family n=1 Tax=Natrinema salaciae TaxID=1186196 RepID=A0A1H9EEQ2_9EURY|nr:universal stress protein [Natrinema salaciae]SEQ24204.1 Nucleotide-binding universal stress protein, UspA family [Natrinema salaciae]
MYHDILVPTDGSDSSAAAVDEAVAIAGEEGATVHFLHVIDEGTEMSAGASGMIAPQVTETLEEEAESALDDAERRAEATGVNYERRTREGDPHEAIAVYVAEHDIDLVVMGASGRSGLKAHLLGSTTDRVVRTVDASVLIARP